MLLETRYTFRIWHEVPIRKRTFSKPRANTSEEPLGVAYSNARSLRDCQFRQITTNGIERFLKICGVTCVIEVAVVSRTVL